MATSDTANIDINQSFPILPEGWQGSPQDLLTWISENAIFKATGASLVGQFSDSAIPTSNVGLLIVGNTIFTWSAGKGKYVPLLTVPIGSVYDWPSQLQNPPDNHLFCEGQLLTITDYPDLYAVLGTTYNRAADATTSFRMPNYLGRVGVGAGDNPGDYNPRQATTIPGGPMALRAVGDYFGYEWPSYNVLIQANAPTPRYTAVLTGSRRTKPTPFSWTGNQYNTVVPPAIGVRKIMRAK